jgi:serine/threonine protein kinase/Flp pilus assembly protein TadD
MPEEIYDDDRTKSFAPILRGTLVSGYRIIKKLGAGGMGEVFLAEDTELGRLAALKFIPVQYSSDLDFKARFVREAQAAAIPDHPNIVTVFGTGDYKGRSFIAMQYVEGQSLRDLIREGELSIELILDMVIQLCDGLDKAHQFGIVHRDIKPSNIIIDADGRPRILDFGLAAVHGKERLTNVGTTLGTIGYMSPEQIRGEKPDARSDVFSLGVVLYEMITGISPFKGKSDVAAINSVLNDIPEPLRKFRDGVPDDLQIIVDKALEKNVEGRYRSTRDFSNELSLLQRIMKPGGATHPSKKYKMSSPRRRLFRQLSPAIGLAIIILIIFIFKFLSGPPDNVTAAQNRLAVMYFGNPADHEDAQRLGEIAADLLITDLSESRYVQVVSDQRLYDILRLIGRENENVIERETATRVARKAGARWMLLGNFLQVEPRIILTSQLVEVGTGDVLASQRIEGRPDEQIFTLVDRLSAEIKKDLTLPAAALTENDRPVANVTTSSMEAYRHYIEGRKSFYEYRYNEAEKSFRKALEYDSTFAMAYNFLAMIKWRENDPATVNMIAKAMQNIDKVTQKEKYYISSLNAFISKDYDQTRDYLVKIIRKYPDEKVAYFWLGLLYKSYFDNPWEAIYNFGKAIEIDSLYRNPYEQLAVAYNIIGDFEKSVWAINKYIYLMPDEAVPYFTRGDIYLRFGRKDRAIESYERALSLKPDYYRALERLGVLYLGNREYAKAESCYRRLTFRPEKAKRSDARTDLALVPLYQGRYDEALRVLDDGIKIDSLENTLHDKEGDMANKHFLKTMIYRDKGDLDAAIAEIEKSMAACRQVNPDDKLSYLDDYICLLAESGDTTAAKRMAEELRELLDKAEESLSGYWFAMGQIKLAVGNLEEAEKLFRTAYDTSDNLNDQFMLATTLFRSDKYKAAADTFEKILSRSSYWYRYGTVLKIKAHYYLGLCYEKLNQRDLAIEEYEGFLDIWKDADPWMMETADAKERLARLKKMRSG